MTRGMIARPPAEECTSHHSWPIRNAARYERRQVRTRAFCWDVFMASSRIADRETALNAVSAALSDVVTKDQDLLALHAHELALVHRFGVYLEAHLRAVLRQDKLTVDLDYDRHGGLPKLLPARPDRDRDRSFRPDLIVHRRRVDTHNLLVVEWKKNADDPTMECLSQRVRSLQVDEGMPPCYRYQLAVLANSSDHGVRWCAFESSAPVNGWQYVGSA